jgi:hypothetical protein
LQLGPFAMAVPVSGQFGTGDNLAAAAALIVRA